MGVLMGALVLASAALDGGGHGGGGRPGDGRAGSGGSDGLTTLTDGATSGLAWPWWVAIGLGVALVVAALGVGLFLWWRSRTAAKDAGSDSAQDDAAVRDDAVAGSSAEPERVVDAEIVEPSDDDAETPTSPFAQSESSDASPQGAQAILADRLAKGEIEPDDYRRRVEALNEV